MENVIQKPNGHYQLIDYGRTFSITDNKFPPMEYMNDDDCIPTKQDDLNTLTKLYSY